MGGDDVASVTSICAQRKKRMLYNTPLPRYTVISPYASQQFTKLQLDMRRKAEILQHNSVQKSTQTNSLTKAQRFAQMVRSPPPISTISNAEPNCLTWTSSSDVPGPRMQLFMDSSVPLYNFTTASRVYGILSTDNVSPWRVYKTTDITNNLLTCLANVSTFLAAIEIFDPIDRPSLVFTVSIPILNQYQIQVLYSDSILFDSGKVTTNMIQIPLLTAPGYFYEIQLISTVTCDINISTVIITAV